MRLGSIAPRRGGDAGVPIQSRRIRRRRGRLRAVTASALRRQRSRRLSRRRAACGVGSWWFRGGEPSYTSMYRVSRRRWSRRPGVGPVIHGAGSGSLQTLLRPAGRRASCQGRIAWSDAGAVRDAARTQLMRTRYLAQRDTRDGVRVPRRSSASSHRRGKQTGSAVLAHLKIRDRSAGLAAPSLSIALRRTSSSRADPSLRALHTSLFWGRRLHSAVRRSAGTADGLTSSRRDSSLAARPAQRGGHWPGVHSSARRAAR